jgi:hypothetical protein
MHRPIAGGFRRAQSARHEGVSEAVCVVGEAGHYLNRPGELRGGVLELIRTHRDRLE